MGIVISTSDAETAWNAYRLANYSLQQGDSVKVFLMGKGVESEVANAKYNMKDQVAKFMDAGGQIYACGTCMKSRNMTSTETCSLSTMKDLYQIVVESDRVLTFG